MSNLREPILHHLAGIPDVITVTGAAAKGSSSQPRAANGQFGSSSSDDKKQDSQGAVEARISKLEAKLTRLKTKLKDLQRAGIVHHGNHSSRITHARAKAPKGQKAPKGSSAGSTASTKPSGGQTQSTAARIAQVQARIAQLKSQQQQQLG